MGCVRRDGVLPVCLPTLVQQQQGGFQRALDRSQGSREDLVEGKGRRCCCCCRLAAVVFIAIDRRRRNSLGVSAVAGSAVVADIVSTFQA